MSPDKIARVDSLVRKLVASFVKPIESVDEFRSVFHPNIEWYDHAFLMCRVGHTAVEGLQKSFTYCNQPFGVDIKVGLNRAIAAGFRPRKHGR